MTAAEQDYQCVIVDDEALGRELIATHLLQFPQFRVVASCASAIEANTIIAENRIDLLFLDIEMPVLKGTDFYRSLRQPPKVIFTTAYRDYAVDGFDLEAVDYLLKPVVFPRFFRAIERFLELQAGTSGEPVTKTAVPEHIFVREDRKEIRLLLSDVLYVKSLRDYLEVYMRDGKHIIKHSMEKFCERVGPRFLRVHRSYLVNKAEVTAVTRHDVEIGAIEIPIGQIYRDRVLRQLGVS